MGSIRFGFVVALLLGALCLVGSATIVQGALAFNNRERVNGVVTGIGEQRDGNGVPSSTATVEWKSAHGTHQHQAKDPDRLAFTVGQIIELKVDPERPGEASTASAGNRVYVAVVVAGIGLYLIAGAFRGGARRPRRPVTSSSSSSSA